MAARDIRYKEHHIPEGAIIVMNTWGIFHDAEVFENPDTFDPERYVKSEYGDGASPDGLRDTLPFGAGRVS
ncbi:hypothetical protein BDN71DRAFT_1451140 [Pleurotus eryngii]|uniref:Uncharacterized protein n=1 Tax=Pleurotus eryngii TaxID=5323 RepID=A0A9P5ZU02_PLEER|nr:hypothetical protein BDN71DRAFT_1451140 [Pleurotus eryngii]